MIDFLFKNDLYAPVSGKLIPIDKVDDDLFSKKLLGDGVAILASDNQISAPINGELTMVFPDGHAFGIKTNKGVEILVHIGLDSATLNNKGCKILKKAKSKVKKGDKIIEIDLDYFNKNNIEPLILIVVTNSNNNTCSFMYPDVVKATVNQIATIQ